MGADRGPTLFGGSWDFVISRRGRSWSYLLGVFTPILLFLGKIPGYKHKEYQNETGMLLYVGERFVLKVCGTMPIVGDLFQLLRHSISGLQS
jgi:hypothetical protein